MRSQRDCTFTMTAVIVADIAKRRTLEHMLRRVREPVALLTGLWLAACTSIIGLDDIELADDDNALASTSGAGAGSTGNGTGTDAATTNGANGSTGSGTGGTSTSASSGTTSATSTATSSNAAASSSSGGNMCIGGDPALDAQELAFLTIINNYRAQNSLGALSACTSLNRAAQGHSDDMRDQNYFSHTSLNGDSPWDRACDACFAQGCGPTTAMAENIAAGNSDAQATFTQWQNSPGHNANMLGASFTMIGIGRATGGGMYNFYWTNVFAGDTEPSCN